MTTLFGRERELAAVRRFLADAQMGYAVLVVDGEAGIGKTSLWLEATRLGNEQNFEVLSCRPAQAEAKLPFASLADLVAPVADDVLRGLPEPQRLALQVALLRTSPGRAPPDPRAIATALLSVLRRLTDTGPVLVAIDDAHWLDRASAAALSFALRRFDPGRALGLLASVRVERGNDADVLGLGQLTSARVDRLRPDPLNLRELYRLLMARLDVVIPRPTLQRIEQESGGNPLFAIELARAITDRDDRLGPGQPLPVPSGLAGLLRARMAKLPDSAREALVLSALVPNPTSALVERALGSSAADALGQASGAGVIEVRNDRIHFVHPLYASALSSSALPDERRDLHRQLTELVDDPVEEARHLSLATTSADESVARTLEQAATLARSRGAWGVAAELFERGRELTPPEQPDAARRRGISAAEHHVHAGDRARGRKLIEEMLAEKPPPPFRADGLRLLAEISHEDENAAEAALLFTQALDYADDPGLMARIELGLVYVYSSLMDWPTAGVHAYRGLARAEESGDRPFACSALAHCVMTDFLCGRGIDWDKVERSLELGDGEALVPLRARPSAIAALLLLYVGRHEEARRRLTALRGAASEGGDESDLAFIVHWMSWLETRSGAFSSAAVLAEEAAALATLTGSHSMYAWALTQQALVHAHLGAVTEARRCCAEASLPVQRSGNRLPAMWIATSLTLLELSLGRPEAAWQASEPLVMALEEHGIAEPVTAVFLPDALEALVALGELDRAEALLAAFEAPARALDRAWALATAARSRGLLLGARGDLPGALAALEQALVEHERLQMPFERSRTLVVRGVVERRSGYRTRAKASLEEARRAFDQMGARVWADRAAVELRRIPTRRRTAADRLTPTEETVADLVARGHTNRQVAGRLSVSEKTVEANLTRIYRKLGVGSRTALTAKILAGERSAGDKPSKV
ncbi:MAG TPA: AAA family ATPase [Egibacteraceae bacterium]|nr:AAA family ATPase [Egibacteraceae bacterium]